MERMLINAAQRDEKRVAIVSENILFDFITERPGFEQKIGNIYLARITSIEPSLDAIFVEYGSDRHGFLPLKEVSRQYFNPKAEQQQGRPGIRDLLRVGQELMVQVEKEERGNKGAALTTYISLAGSYLVLMPNSPRAGGISRRIEGDERDQLREILNQVSVPEGMGLIVRTAAIGRTNEELKWDLDVLLAHWKNIEDASKSRHAPFLIHQEGNVVIRAIRDYVRQDTAEIIIDDETEFQNAKHYLEQIRPDVADRVKLYSDTTPLFIRYGIEHQIETAYKRTIDLPSGASIVIDYTEALVSIDINSARATKGSNIEATAFNTNLEAAEEIARQLRLRDIGGLIVIDFIDMLEPNNQIEVEKHLSKCLKQDRARIQIQRISRFGLLEMSRQRLRPSLRDTHQHVCPTCAGHGSIRGVDSVALSLVRIIEEEALKPHTAEIIIQASTEAATYLLNEKRHLIAAIEKNHDLKVSVIPNPNLQSSNYLKKRIRSSDTDELGLDSSERLQAPQVDIQLPSASDKTTAKQPAVKQMIPTRPEKVSTGGGLIKRLINSMFGQQEEGSSSSEEGETSSSSTDTSYQSKPSYQQRSPSSKQRSRRPARGEESYEGQENRDRSSTSRERSSSGRRYNEGTRSGDRSDSRSSDSRQRGSGPKRGTSRNAPPTKSASTKSSQYSDSYQDQYKEYAQQSDTRSTPAIPKTTPVTEPLPKPITLDKVAEEAPITIKAGGISSATSKAAGPSIKVEAKPGTPEASTASAKEGAAGASTPANTSSNQSAGISTSARGTSTQGSSFASTPSSTSSNQATGTSSTPTSSTLAQGSSLTSTPSSTASGQASSATPIPISSTSAQGSSVASTPSSSTSAQGSSVTSTTSSSATSQGTGSTASPMGSASTQRSVESSTSDATKAESLTVQASSTQRTAKPTTTTFAPSSSSASTRSFKTYAPSSASTQKPSASSTQTPPVLKSETSNEQPSNVETTPSDEKQKPLIIRAATEDKTNPSTPPTTTSEKKDKESTEN